MKTTLKFIALAIVAASTAAQAEPLAAQALRDNAAAKAVAGLASYNMDKAAKTGDAAQISRAQQDLNSALSQVRSTALRAQIAQQKDAQAAAVGQLNALKAQDIANRQAQVTAHMNQVTANMQQQLGQTPAAPAPTAAQPTAPTQPATPAAPLTQTVNIAAPAAQPAAPAIIGATPAPQTTTTTAPQSVPGMNPSAFQAAVAAAVAKSGVPNQISVQTAPAAYSQAMEQANVQGSINVAASSIKASTPVTAVINGVAIQTTAGVIAQVSPEMQIAVPHKPALIAGFVKGGNDHSKSSSQHGGTGNGGQNAANSRSGMAHGFGDNHVGGGSAQSGSRNVGHW